MTAVATTALVALDARHGTLRDDVVGWSIGWYLVAFAGFVAAVVAVERRRTAGPLPTRWWAWLVAVPVVVRLALMATEPTLSDDVYRYLWDGHLLTNGVNPYQSPVASPALDAYDVPIRSLVNNPQFSTPYLPIAEWLFALVTWLGPLRATSMQLVMTVFDLGTALLVVRALDGVGLPRSRVVLYLWNPLVMIETAHGAHLDAFMTFLTLGALVTAWSPRPAVRAASAALTAGAILTRGLPALLLPVLWWRWRWSHRAVLAVAVIAPIAAMAQGVGLGLDGAAADDGTGVFGSARAYGELWQFNALVFDLVERSAPGSDPGGLARAAIGACMVAIAGAVAWRARRRQRPTRNDGPNDDRPDDIGRRRGDVADLALLFGAYVVLTPTLHPWYLVALLALLPLMTPTPAPGPRSADRWAGWLPVTPWLWLAATAPLSYLTYLDPAAPAERSWVRQVEWWPTLALLVLAALWIGADDDRADRSRVSTGH